MSKQNILGIVLLFLGVGVLIDAIFIKLLLRDAEPMIQSVLRECPKKVEDVVWNFDADLSGLYKACTNIAKAVGTWEDKAQKTIDHVLMAAGMLPALIGLALFCVRKKSD